jgi:hypothetical protein
LRISNTLISSDSIDDNINKEVLDDILRDKLGAKLRVCYDRTAYESGMTRITLDSNLMYQLEDQDICYENNSHGITFPYNILELKIESDAQCAIIDELIRRELILYMPKFSKYINGCFKYYPEKVNLSPYWKDSLPQFAFNEVEGEKIIPLANNFNLIVGNEKLFVSMNNFALKLFLSAFFLVFTNKLYLLGAMVFGLATYMNFFSYFQFKMQDGFIRDRNNRLYDRKYGYDLLQILNWVVIACMGYILYAHTYN